jgi:hypothetical protein
MINSSSKEMKTLMTIVIAIWSSAAFAIAHPQVEHLKEAYKSQGDVFFVPLYWLPETRQTVLKHIPDHQNWVGFESKHWKELTEETKLKLIDELGTEFERFDGPKVNATWNRIRDWQQITSQLSLLSAFLDQDEGFLDMAYNDPVLRPAFKWITDRRKADFDTKFIGSTLTSGEMISFYPVLTEHLLNTTEQQRLECFSRLLAKIAKAKAPKAEQGADGNSN